ncbi:hypothetical protein LJC68_09535 [Bacteroidales bacterium OttesenSCG-928-B11]|nr:hypothetical protein [Bacteroidales bacterium OttesenSCG-928-B11]
MKTLQTLTFILALGLFSCNGKTESSATKNENVLSDTQVVVSIPDTIKKFVVDDYPVTNEMLADKASNNSSYKKQSGQTFSCDKAWFSNDTLKQTLVFELYTDYHRFVTYHFLDNDIPTDLINRMELHIGGGELASDKQKLKDFSGFLKQTTKINSSCFITDKGFRLGSTKQKAVETYGNPDKQTITDGIEKLEWLFIGDASYDAKADLKGKPLAANSFGHQILMYFRNGKLIGQILHNDIP